jgi:hypothetical protein
MLIQIAVFLVCNIPLYLMAADSGIPSKKETTTQFALRGGASADEAWGGEDPADHESRVDSATSSTAGPHPSVPSKDSYGSYSRDSLCLKFDGYLSRHEYRTAFSLFEDEVAAPYVPKLESSFRELRAHVSLRVPQVLEELIRARSLDHAHRLLWAYKNHNRSLLDSSAFKSLMETSLTDVLGEMARESVFMRDDSRRDKAMEGASLFNVFEFATDLREVVTAQYAEAQETLKAIIDIELAERERRKEEAETPLARAARLAQAERDQVFSEAMKRAIPPIVHQMED